MIALMTFNGYNQNTGVKGLLVQQEFEERKKDLM